LIALVITFGLGLILVSATAAAKAVAAERQRQSLVAYRLSFPKGLAAEDVVSCLSGLSGLLLPWWRRWGALPHVVIETVADAKGGIRHQVLVPEHWAPTLENILQASLPAVRFERAEIETLPIKLGAEYRLSAHGRSLTVDAAALSAKLLHSLQPLGGTEAVTVAWTLTPAGPVAPVRIAATDDKQRFWQPAGTVPDGESAAALKAKQSGPLMLGVARIGVAAPSNRAARRLLRRIEGSWHESRSPGVHLKRRLALETAVAGAITRRTAPALVWPSTYNVGELAGLVGWPVGATSVPGLVLGGSRLLAASPIIPTSGTILADSNFPGQPRVLALDLQGRLRNVYCLGPTGSGKSWLLIQMVLQDIAAGRSTIVLDPKGDLCREILLRIPEGQRGNVVVVNPADTQFAVGINPLRVSDADQAETTVENLLGLFRNLWSSAWGARTDDICRAVLASLIHSGEYTLCEIAVCLTDPNFRRRVVGKLDDPLGTQAFWGWFESISDAERLSVTAPLLNKVRAFTMRPRVRAVVGQVRPKITVADVMASGKIMLCSLEAGVLGQEAAQILGALIVSEIWNATTARAAIPADQRRPVMAYLDEWQNFLHLATPMSTVLAESRGFKVGWTLAHQETGQLTPELRSAVFANARSRIVYQLPADDARLLARQMGGPLTADDLQGLGAYEVAAQLFAAGSTQTAATGLTRPLGPPSADPDEIRRWSREQYGVDRDEIEIAIRKRQMGSTAGPIGRRPKPDQDGGGHD
jgi:hypothetical protein